MEDYIKQLDDLFMTSKGQEALLNQKQTDTLNQQLKDELSMIIYLSQWDITNLQNNKKVDTIFKNLVKVHKKLTNEDIEKDQIKEKFKQLCGVGSEQMHPRQLSDFISYVYSNPKEITYLFSDNQIQESKINLKITVLETTYPDYYNKGDTFIITPKGMEGQGSNTNTHNRVVRFGRFDQKINQEFKFSQKDDLISRNQFLIQYDIHRGYLMFCTSWTNPTQIQLKKEIHIKNDMNFIINNNAVSFVIDDLSEQIDPDQEPEEYKGSRTRSIREEVSIKHQRINHREGYQQNNESPVFEQQQQTEVTRNIRQQNDILYQRSTNQQNQQCSNQMAREEQMKPQRIKFGIDWSKVDFVNKQLPLQWEFNNIQNQQILIGSDPKCHIQLKAGDQFNLNPIETIIYYKDKKWWLKPFNEQSTLYVTLKNYSQVVKQFPTSDPYIFANHQDEDVLIHLNGNKLLIQQTDSQ